MRFGDVAPYLPQLAQGLLVTLIVTVGALVIGLLVGGVLAVLRGAKPMVVRGCTAVFVEFFRTTPPLVQLVWAFFVLPVLTGVNLSAAVAATLALGLNTAAFMSEIFRAGIAGVPAGQLEAARVLSLSRVQIFRCVVAPQAFRLMLPAIATQGILLFKDTPLVAIIAVGDLMYTGNLVALDSSRPTETLIVVAAMFAAVVYAASFAISKLEKGLRRSHAVT